MMVKFEERSRGAEAATGKAARRMPGRLPLLALVFCLACPRLYVSAEVGILKGGITREVVMQSIGKNWSNEGGACFMGQSHNLIVDPVIDGDFMMTQKLLTDLTGPRVCQWLDSLYKMHMEQKPLWEASHKRSK